MDELVHHCIRELAFEGDLGCDVSRLSDFIRGFYTHGGAAQNVDDAYCSFIWSVVVQQPDVRVGIAPEGAPEVYVAPQQSKTPAIGKKNHGKKKTDEGEGEEAGAGGSLVPVPDPLKSLDELKAQYGDKLRIAVDHERSFVAITGSHIRPSKLTPMVYTALQLISRGRESGLSTVDLSRKTGYDPKTCHYLVDKLLELNLIEKRKKAGVGANLCIHKYFFERSKIWQGVQAEELEATQTVAANAEDVQDEEEEDLQTPAPHLGKFRFGSIETRHLSSLPLIRGRIEKLLRNSPHQMHASQNLLVKIGFNNPTKSDRRFFSTRVRELMAQGVIDKVQVPREKGKSVTCVRLLERPSEVEQVETEDGELPTLKANVTFHRQLVDLVDQSGVNGMTLNELSQGLCNFDKRIVEHQLERLHEPPPPPHLVDLGITQLGESHKRERRYKYFSSRNYQIVDQRENLGKAKPESYFAHVGEFAEVDEKLFYKDEKEFIRYVDDFPEDGGAAPSAKGKPKKHTNPILPDGTVKKGRPRKADSVRGRKRRREEENAAAGPSTEDGIPDPASVADAPPPKRKRGRPPKPRPPVVEADDEAGPSTTVEVDAEAATSASVQAPRKRGRPRKSRPEDESAMATPTPTPAPKRKRGRPPKNRPQEATASAAEGGEVGGTEIVADADTAMNAEAAGTPTVTTTEAAEGPSNHADESFFDVAAASQQPSDGSPLRRSTRLRQPRVIESVSPVTTLSSRTRKRARETSPEEVSALLEGHAEDMDVDERPPSSAQLEGVDAAPLAVESQTIQSPPIRDAAAQAGSSVSAVETSTQDVSEPAASTQVAEPTGVDATPGPIASASQQDLTDPSVASSVEPPSKRAKTAGPSTGYRARVNITQSRREKEILRVIEEAGGVINISAKDFYENHAALVDSLAEAGQAVSTQPGSRIDKRTLESALRELESQGKVKQLTTSVQSLTGVNRQVKITYLHDLPTETLNKFLADLRRTPIALPAPAFKVLEQPLDYGGSRRQRVARPAASVILLNAETNVQHDSQKADKLLQLDDKTIQASLLTEGSTIMQLYGFIPGKIVRLKALHTHTVGVLAEASASKNIISNEQRVVHYQYFMEDLPVSVYCSVVSCRTQNVALTRVLGTPEGRQTPVGQLAHGISDDLEIGKSRSRARISDLLNLLCGLGLVVPLEASKSEAPYVACAQTDDHPTHFDKTTFDSTSAPTTPHYWQFVKDGPIHFWALSDDGAPFWKFASTADGTSASQYWKDLEKASTDVDFAKETLAQIPNGELRTVSSEASPGLVKLLRRPTQWKDSYNFSWFQKQYLRRQQDAFTNAASPEAAALQLTKIANIVSAPSGEVSRFYDSERERLAREAEKAHTRKRHADGEDVGRRAAEDKATLAQKVAAAKAQRESDWDELLKRVHPEPVKGSLVTRIRQVRAKYMQAAGSDSEKWEAEIAAAIEETKRAPVKRNGGVARPPHLSQVHLHSIPVPPPFTSQIPEKAVEELVAQQGPPLTNRTPKSAKKGKNAVAAEEEPGRNRRRHRFQWNKDYDELARDASAIIKARCRDGKRLDWGALEQVFTAVPRNTVRQRIGNLREQPGAEAYFKRLEDRWYELWQTYLDTPELPDPDPQSATNFNIIAHIKFLRKHIDKNALRVGFLQTELPVTASLPVTADALPQQWDIVEKFPSAPTWDFIWNGTAEEGREKQFVQQAFVASGNEVPTPRMYASERIHVADSALKMVLGTPNEVYDSEQASRVLASAGEQVVQAAKDDLLDRGVLSKVVRDPTKHKPGRLLKISEVNQNAIGGSVSGDLFQDAAALEEALIEEADSLTWREWSFLSTDGDTAALIELVSDNRVDFKVDTSRPRKAREGLDWNSKKTDDDDIESAIAIRAKLASQRTPTPPEPVRETNTTLLETTEGPSDMSAHGLDRSGKKASCRNSTLGPVNCATCLSMQIARLEAQAKAPAQLATFRRISALLDEAKDTGLTKAQLKASFTPLERDFVVTAVRLMTDADITLAHWMGYGEIVLVSSDYISSWTVVCSEEPHIKISPRRWLDIDGRRISEIWEAARKAVMGAVLFHPGISQAELRWRLRSVYDRQEVSDVIEHLLSEGYLLREWEGRALFGGSPADNSEEKRTFLSIGKKCWYTL